MTGSAGRRREGSALLRGNGVLLVRERALAAAVQTGLERLYQLDRVAEVHEYVSQAEEGEREALLVREDEDGIIEMELRLPELAQGELHVDRAAHMDPLCQLIEGVSHFVYLADRASSDRETTQLELELQAEVDKYVVLSASVGSVAGLDPRTSARLRERLYEQVTFMHPEGTLLGDRYRMANELAGRFVRKLEREYVVTRRFGDMRRELRSFYRLGQEEKLRVGRAG